MKKSARATENTKEAMLRIAIEGIDKSGEDGVRLDQVLEEVGVSPSSLYHHYGNLNGLIEAAQIERFRRVNLVNAMELKRSVEAAETLEEFKKLIDLLLETYLNSKRTVPRLQRANALGSAYGRPDMLKRLGESQAEALDIGTEAINIAKYKGFVRKELDSRAFIAWFDSQSFGRVLIEVTQDKKLAVEWNKLAIQAAHVLLFGDNPGN